MRSRNLILRSLFVPLLALSVTHTDAFADNKKSDSKAKARTTYDEHIVPLFERKCFGCHNPDKRKGGLALNTYSLLFEGGSSGVVIKPGDVDGSRLWLLVDHQEEPHMPPRGGKLSDADLAVISKWIEQGAAENKSSKVKLPDKPKLDLAAGANPNARPEGPPPMPRGLSLDPVARSKRTTAVTAIASNPWSSLIAVSGQRQVLLYDAVTAELAGVLPFPEGIPHVLKFSRNGAILLAGGGRAAHSGRVVLWNVRSGERLTVLGGQFDTILAADITADHEYVALGGPSKMICIYRTSDGELIREIKKHTDWIYTMEFSPDGVLLATADRAGGMHVWETFSGREYLNLRGHADAVTDLSWRLDSNALVSSSEDQTVRLWELENGRQIKRWNAHSGGTLSVEFGRDGKIATAGRDRRTRLWDQNGKKLRDFEAFTDLALETTIVSESDRVVAGGWNGEVWVWNAKDGKRTASLSTNPESLDVLLAASQSTLKGAKSKHDEIAARVAQVTAKLEKLRGEVSQANLVLEELQTIATSETKEREGAVRAAEELNKKLQAALQAAQEKGQSYAELTKAGTADGKTIKAAKEALDKLEETASQHAAALAEALRNKSRFGRNLRDTTRKIQGLELKAKSSGAPIPGLSKSLAADQKSLTTLAGQLSTAQTGVARWTAAVGVRDSLAAIAKESESRRELLASLTAAQAELQSLTDRYSKTMKDAATAFSQRAPDAETTKKAYDDAVGRIFKEGGAAKNADFDAVEKAAVKYAKAQEEAAVAIESGLALIKDARPILAEITNAQKSVAELESEMKAIVQRLELSRKTWRDWTSKYETASKPKAAASKDLAAK